jgi:hypothetical protein
VVRPQAGLARSDDAGIGVHSHQQASIYQKWPDPLNLHWTASGW